MQEVTIPARPIERFRRIFRKGNQVADALELAAQARRRLEGRVVWNVNSTAVGGGVAEMLRALLPYVRGAGIDIRWVVIEGTPEFFRVTKRLHHALHGSAGDGSSLDATAREIYEGVLADNAAELCSVVRARDVVILHDPQTAGLAPHLLAHGALVIWRCHIGHDVTHPQVEQGWRFLYRYLKDVPAFVFSRASYVPDYCDHHKSTIITPSIDAFSPKNQPLHARTVRAILVHVGIVEGPSGDGLPVFRREDGSPGRVDRQADVIRLGRAPAWEEPLVVQVSRWDPLKDPLRVMLGFAELLRRRPSLPAHLVLAGPNVTAVADDPEGAAVLDQVIAAWRDLPHSIRHRVHLVSLPMADVEENAAIVNALQRHAAIVVQKSIQEGFGLTVTEAMWKARPVVASAVGGIQDQIEDGVHGLLLRDPTDLEAFGSAIQRLLENPSLASRLGRNARKRVRTEFLGIQHLGKYARLFERLETAQPAQVPTRTPSPAA